MKQSEALDILKMGRNVFLTGPPGSGKTHTVNEYVAYLKSHGVEPAITASTGISATHIGGLTIHSWSGIGIKNSLDKHGLKKIISGYVAKRVKRAKVLIIDEVSMLSGQTFSMVDRVCREIKDTQKPFGGLQVVVVGDFFQLPPIVKKEPTSPAQMDLLAESSGRFSYDALAWKGAKFTVCYLDEQHRQDDRAFLDLLSAIRRNQFSKEHLLQIQARQITSQIAPKTAPKLFSHNVDVDRVNHEILEKLPGEQKIFSMFSDGPEPLVFALKRGCLSPEALSLKIGAQVMFTKNNVKEGFVNGTLGTVQTFAEHTKEPVVKTRDGRILQVRPMDWMVEENGKIRAKVTQFPLRLAWAITVHKSQGMSLDEAVMDLGNVFEFGQGYVALSRVRRFSGLHLLGWNDRAFRVHPDVLEKDADFQEQSIMAQRLLGAIASHDMKKMQEEFIIASGGKIISENATVENAAAKKAKFAPPKPVGAYSVKKIREKHASAYMPWDDAQDAELRALFAKKLSASELADAFNRTKGSIRSRLIKLGLLDE